VQQNVLGGTAPVVREVGDRPGEEVTLSNMGLVAQGRGRLDEAQRYFEQSLAIAHETQYAELETAARANLADLTARQHARDGATR
jgi:hypothetical protein